MGFFASVNGVVTAGGGGARLRARQRVHVRRRRVRDAAHVRPAGRSTSTGTWPRLRRSADRLRIALPVGDGEMARRLDALLERSGHAESYIRIIVSRGVGDISYHFDRVKGPTVVMVTKPFQPFPEAHYRDGIAVILSSVRRNHPRALDPGHQVLQPPQQRAGRAGGAGPGRGGADHAERRGRRRRGRQLQRVRREVRRARHAAAGRGHPARRHARGC